MCALASMCQVHSLILKYIFDAAEDRGTRQLYTSRVSLLLRLNSLR